MTTKREPSGKPSGGQFAATQHDEPDTVLDPGLMSDRPGGQRQENVGTCTVQDLLDEGIADELNIDPETGEATLFTSFSFHRTEVLVSLGFADTSIIPATSDGYGADPKTVINPTLGEDQQTPTLHGQKHEGGVASVFQVEQPEGTVWSAWVGQWWADRCDDEFANQAG